MISNMTSCRLMSLGLSVCAAPKCTSKVSLQSLLSRRLATGPVAAATLDVVEPEEEEQEEEVEEEELDMAAEVTRIFMEEEEEGAGAPGGGVGGDGGGSPRSFRKLMERWES